MEVVIEGGGVLEPVGRYERVICKGSAVVRGKLEADEVICRGKMKADELDVDRIEAGGVIGRKVRAGELMIGYLEAGIAEVGTAEVRGPLRVSGSLRAEWIRAEGSISCTSLEAREIRTSGSLRALKAVIDMAEVRGSLEVSEGRLGQALVDGSAKLGDCHVTRIVVGGTLRVTGRSEVGEAEASMVDVSGHLSGGTLRVGEVLKVEGEVRVRRLEVGGALRIRGSVSAEEARISGRGEGRVEGRKVNVTGEVTEVAGEDIELVNARVSKVTGSRVRIRDSHVGTVSAEEVEVIGRSRVLRVNARRVYVSGGIVERVFYTEKLLVSPEAEVKHQTKVGEL